MRTKTQPTVRPAPTPVPGPAAVWPPVRPQLPVPYVVSWSAERSGAGERLCVRSNGEGLGYRDERAEDRDHHGVLWARSADGCGEGRPVFPAMHPLRQREAMFNRLCQVCAKPASRTSDGVLFLNQREAEGDGEEPDHWEGALTTKPPVCLPCAALAVRLCPHLTDPIAIRSRAPRLWGVFGGFFVSTLTGGWADPVPGTNYLRYGSPDQPWFLANQLVVQLRRCTVVDLRAELATV
ncbi:hypothetical protein FH609_015400 [Streptomyces sp. 3MP-14]|uniref:Uncharacterized protein n=1 Tax=Streptomyces mimosae TaxID=2586635 RepID=A0A5N6AE50_9ACTN|nr:MULTISPECIES: hypothetical protein [Streptomyces]KAB8165788.1 hypothetical protein FH607_012725 [Streptomyces mimosae]KAB8176177.1 hypothetical protein FH609_015400 [Streptomyces sp. 3MP-14]